MAAVVLFPPFPFLPAPLKGEREFREIPHVPFFPFREFRENRQHIGAKPHVLAAFLMGSLLYRIDRLRKNKMQASIGTNEIGYRVGESHQLAKLSDNQIEEMRTLYEAGRHGYSRLAKLFNVPKRTVRDIVNYRRRNQIVCAWRKAK